jgi:hypothetical protein
MMTGSDVMFDEWNRFVKEQPDVNPLSRRQFLDLTLAAPAGLALASAGQAIDMNPADVHQQLLDLAARQEERRRARFAAIASKADLNAPQTALRETFLRLLDGFPEKTGIPPVRKTGIVEADDYVIEELAYESFPGYFVSGLLYKPRTIASPRPGILSPCGHSTTGKAADAYQTLHMSPMSWLRSRRGKSSWRQEWDKRRGSRPTSRSTMGSSARSRDF